MESKIIIANLKMNQSPKEVAHYVKDLQQKVYSKNIVICPSSIYIPYFLNQAYSVGIQNVYYKSKGNYTGEISPLQASQLGVKYVLVGHGERRNYFEESDQDINKKIKECLKYPLEIILCIGENLEEKNLYKTTNVLKRQITNALHDIKKEDLKHIIIAYEPLWISGTDSILTNQDIYDTIEYVKTIIKRKFDGTEIRVIYGGNVNPTTIKTLNSITNVSGFLIGSTALETENLETIIEVAVKE